MRESSAVPAGRKFRLLRLSSRGAMWGCLLLMPVGCCHREGAGEQTPPAAAEPADAIHCTLSGTVKHPGVYVIPPGSTVSWVLAHDASVPPGEPLTLALVRRAPEGQTRELIPLDSTGHLLDAKQDYVLRDGDQLIFSSSVLPGGNPTKPTLPNRPGQ